MSGQQDLLHGPSDIAYRHLPYLKDHTGPV